MFRDREGLAKARELGEHPDTRTHMGKRRERHGGCDEFRETVSSLWLEGASVRGPERSEAMEAGRGQILSVTLLCLILS